MSRSRAAPPNPEPDKPLRADARRNRDRVLAVARRLFESEGIAVEMDEIARQAGVGVGTIYRHFPTKDALIRGVADGFVERLVVAAHARSDADDPGAAFFEYLAILAGELAAKRSLGHAMADVDLTPAHVAERRVVFHEALGVLLTRAQRARAVRPDVTVADVVVLIRAPISSGDPDAATRRRLLEVVSDGLRLRR
jgi:AcrR family transcriptional regulator